MRKNKRKHEGVTNSSQIPEMSREANELCKAIGYIRAACENLNNLYLMAKQRGDSEEEMYYCSRFQVIHQTLWSLMNH